MDESFSAKAKSAEYTRREFLKLSAAFLTAALTGCVGLDAEKIHIGLDAKAVKPKLPEPEPLTQSLITPDMDTTIPEFIPTKNLTDRELLNRIVTETREQYPYPSFLYPVSKNLRLPETFPLNKCETELVWLDRSNGHTSDQQDSYLSVETAAVIVSPLQDMISKASADGMEPFIRSGFRSISTQTTLFEQNVKRLISEQNISRELAEDIANQASAKPGFSEHHTGFAVDIVDKKMGNYSPGDNLVWDIARENPDLGLYGWLRSHSHEYGFVLSYPGGLNPDISKTGSGYESAEPWHIRFVGVPLAGHLHKSDYLNPKTNITLNSLLQDIEKSG